MNNQAYDPFKLSDTSSDEDDRPVIAKRRRDVKGSSGDDAPIIQLSSDDDAPIMQLSAAAAALQDADWTKELTAIDEVVKGLTSFCASMGLVCQGRIRSSDKSRATISCKWQQYGCPLRLTVKKATGRPTFCNANMVSFVIGTCTQPPPSHHPCMRPVSPAMQAAEAHPVPSSKAAEAHPVPSSTESSIPAVSVASSMLCTDCPYEDDDPQPCIITCAAGRHHYCGEHMDALAKYQVGVQKSAFLRAECQFRCPHDHSILDMQKVIAAVSKVTWGQINTALQEQAVIDTQKSLMSLAPAAKVSPHDAAMEQIRYRAQPRCKSCSALLTDFEACSALTCGVIKSGHRESGCGARICAWCLQKCSSRNGLQRR